MDVLYVFLFSLVGLFFLLFNTILFVTDSAVNKKVFKVFLVYLISLLIIEITCHIIGYLYPNLNLFISHFYFIFQFTFLSILFHKLFKEKIIKQIIVSVFIVQILILAYIYYLNPELFWSFNIYEIVSTSFILVVYALLFIIKNFEKQHNYFNFSLGLILYLCCSITIFLSGNFDLVLFRDPYIDIWVFNSLFYIIFQYMIYREYLFFKKQSISIR
ncbi:hypothetical protein [Bizionia psychrotolerans]|uniref:hypothetical protein n=1 Tax=Bizionia psychrotolerans TaxID=1492901 RepID=UPI000650D4EE|nr:hypothetical protein [Bizionia psychrotolerans]